MKIEKRRETVQVLGNSPYTEYMPAANVGRDGDMNDLLHTFLRSIPPLVPLSRQVFLFLDNCSTHLPILPSFPRPLWA